MQRSNLSTYAIAGLLFACGCEPSGGGEPAVHAESDGATDAGETSAGADPSAAARVREVVATQVDKGFSGSILVRLGGELIVDDAYGLADRDAGRPNRTDTVYTMGSVTKQVTGAATMALVEEGLVDLDAPISSYLSDVPPDKADITVHQLLTHTSGITPNVGADHEVLERDAFLERVWATPLEQDPGGPYIYSNVGYAVLAAIIEIVRGESYEEVLARELFEPAGMVETGYVLPGFSEERVATGYFGPVQSLHPLAMPWADDGPYWNLRGNGGLLTTTADLLRWHDALAGDTVLSPASVELYQRAHVDEMYFSTWYAYGWVSEDTPAGRLLWHDGGNGFFFAEMLRFMDADLVIVMLTNQEGDLSGNLSRQIAFAALPDLAGWIPG